MNKTRISREELYNLYIEQKLSSSKIAKIYGYKSPNSILNLLKKYNIPTRDKYQCQNCKNIDKDILYSMYVTQKLSCDKIAEILGIGYHLVWRNLKRHNIPIRDRSEYEPWNTGLNKKKCESLRKGGEKISKKRKELFLNGKLKHWNEGKHHSEETKRKLSLANKGKRMGADNHNWKGGLYNGYTVWKRRIVESYDFKQFRLKIYERDNYCCQMCGKESNGDLQLHHIKVVHKFKDLIMEEKNCITLCKKCHTKIRNHEEEWEEFFDEKIQNKYK